MADIAPILEHLAQARVGLLSAADAVSRSVWQTPPRSGAWSAAEVVAHLTMVETRITNGAAKLVSGAPPHVPLIKSLHLPVWLAEWRGYRAKSPIPLDPKLVGEKEEMLARLRELRQRTLGLLEENRERELSAYRWPHPFFGSLDFYQWFRMIAHHEARHTKQILEIVETFQK